MSKQIKTFAVGAAMAAVGVVVALFVIQKGDDMDVPVLSDIADLF